MTRGVWWISPLGAIALISLPVVLLAHAISWTGYITAWRTPKWLDDSSLWLLLAGLTVLAASASVTRLVGPQPHADGSWPDLPESRWTRLRTAARVLFWLTMTGYAVFIGAAVARGLRPSTLVEALTGQDILDSGLRDGLFKTIPGLTTLTQVGVAFSVVATLLLAKRTDRALLLQLGAVTFLALARAYLLAERLALLELALPITAILALRFRDRTRAALGILFIRLVPLIAVPLAIVYFGLLEYSRSWNFFKTQTGGGFWEFALQRFTGYYVTAINNGQVQLLHQPDDWLPRETLSAFWEAPGISQIDLFGALSPPNTVGFSELLEQYATPEFNSPCGLCSPFVDWGTAGGYLWLAAAGAIAGLLYAQFCRGSLLGLLLYPLAFVSLYELPRLLYVTQGRTTPALVALVATWLYVRRAGPVGQPGPPDTATVTDGLRQGSAV